MYLFQNVLIMSKSTNSN